jgi:predicted chitinase
MSKTYNTPKLVAKGDVIELTKGIPGGKNDLDEVTRFAAVGSVGFGL